MKKILLALFLMLGVVSFAALQLDTNKLQKKRLWDSKPRWVCYYIE